MRGHSPRLIVEARLVRLHDQAGRRIGASTLAREPGLSLIGVRELRRATQQAGALVATPVGASSISAHNPRLTSRANLELAHHALQSTEARFLAHIS